MGFQGAREQSSDSEKGQGAGKLAVIDDCIKTCRGYIKNGFEVLVAIVHIRAVGKDAALNCPKALASTYCILTAQRAKGLSERIVKQGGLFVRSVLSRTGTRVISLTSWM